MAVLKIRGEDGVVREVVSLKGDKGEGGGATNAKDLFYDGADEFIGATNVEEALKKTSNAIIDMHGDIDSKANYTHEHQAHEVFYTNPEWQAGTVNGALNYLFEQFGGVETALDSILAIQESLIGGDS